MNSKIKYMINKKYNKEAGQVARLFLILAIVILVAVIIVFIVMRAATAPPKPVVEQPTGPEILYEAQLGDVKFTFIEARDMGKVLLGSKSNRPDWQKDLTTTEKFIIVTIGAQNKGKENVPERVWDLGNIIDSEGRIYEPLGQTANPWRPDPNLCGELLKPEFAPLYCVKVYEVSRVSTGLKIVVSASKKQSDGDYSSSDKDKETALIDLIVTQ